MHLSQKECLRAAFTRIELILSAFVMVMLCFLIPQLIWRGKHATQLSACAANLKQLAIAQCIFMEEHGFIAFLPGQRSTNEGGTMEYLQNGDLAQHFKCFTNELTAPNVLRCPSDDRTSAVGFSALGNPNLSYFVNRDTGRVSGSGPIPLDSRDCRNTVAIGDRNVTNSAGQYGGVAIVDRNQELGWNLTMHNKAKRRSQLSLGNVAFTDGSAVNLTPAGLRDAFDYPGTSRLVLP